MLRYLKSQVKELHISIACDEEHEKVFLDVTTISFKKKLHLKPHLVRTVLQYIYNGGICEPYYLWILF